eukprot:gene3636-7251_t
MSIFLEGLTEKIGEKWKWSGNWHFAKEKKAPQKFSYEWESDTIPRDLLNYVSFIPSEGKPNVPQQNNNIVRVRGRKKTKTKTKEKSPQAHQFIQGSSSYSFQSDGYGLEHSEQKQDLSQHSSQSVNDEKLFSKEEQKIDHSDNAIANVNNNNDDDEEGTPEIEEGEEDDDDEEEEEQQDEHSSDSDGAEDGSDHMDISPIPTSTTDESPTVTALSGNLHSLTSDESSSVPFSNSNENKVNNNVHIQTTMTTIMMNSNIQKTDLLPPSISQGVVVGAAEMAVTSVIQSDHVDVQTEINTNTVIAIDNNNNNNINTGSGYVSGTIATTTVTVSDNDNDNDNDNDASPPIAVTTATTTTTPIVPASSVPIPVVPVPVPVLYGGFTEEELLNGPPIVLRRDSNDNDSDNMPLKGLWSVETPIAETFFFHGIYGQERPPELQCLSSEPTWNPAILRRNNNGKFISSHGDGVHTECEMKANTIVGFGRNLFGRFALLGVYENETALKRGRKSLSASTTTSVGGGGVFSHTQSSHTSSTGTSTGTSTVYVSGPGSTIGRIPPSSSSISWLQGQGGGGSGVGDGEGMVYDGGYGVGVDHMYNGYTGVGAGGNGETENSASTTIGSQKRR